MLSHLDLFSGIGGFALAARWAGFETIAFCEKDAFCRKVLRKNFGDVPCHEDIRTLSGEPFRGVGLLTGGFPCQGFSLIGKRAGVSDPRYLWPEMLRIIGESRPRWVVAENVVGVLDVADAVCLPDLEGLGYEVWAAVIPAVAVGAPHRRDRAWIIAHADTEPGERRPQPQRADCPGGETRAEPVWGITPAGTRFNGSCEPPVRRVDDGIPRQLDRLGALGNAIVPQVAYEILRGIAAWEPPQ